MELIAPFMILGALTFWGWIIFLGGLLFLCWITEYEFLDVGVFFALIAGAIACWIYGFNPFVWVMHNTVEALLWALAYVVVGVLWSFFKYDSFAKDQREQYEKDRAKGYVGTLTSDDIKTRYFSTTYRMTRKFNNWIFGWPFSFVSYILKDVLRHLSDAIISYLRIWYDKIAMRHFKDIIKE